ncbi:MAG: helix-turn-helix transcriptional regulator [Clostridiales bacterium]|nr:helix-turn-helix transcriptional regulator [Clostridiales bacterium]
MDNLIKLRKERNLSTREIAIMLNVSKSTYNHWETGRSEPSIEYLKALSDFFCVSVDYLIGNEPKREVSSAPGLSKREEELLKAFDCLDVYQQDFFFNQITATARENTLIKK